MRQYQDLRRNEEFSRVVHKETRRMVAHTAHVSQCVIFLDFADSFSSQSPNKYDADTDSAGSTRSSASIYCFSQGPSSPCSVDHLVTALTHPHTLCKTLPAIRENLRGSRRSRVILYIIETHGLSVTFLPELCLIPTSSFKLAT
jgi:hypothetical protein